jgi:hypothetical protein
MAAYTRVSAEEARRAVDRGDAILVNAYDDEAKWQSTRVRGATSFMDFTRASAPPPDKRVAFYCA